MSPVIKIRNGVKEYKSNIYQLGKEPDDFFEKDDKLNELIEVRLAEVVELADPKELKRNKVSFYWRTGSMLRDILFNSNLVEKEDKDLFFANVSLHMSKYDCYPMSDPSKNRIIPEQFFRLSGYSEKVATSTIWTAWSYIFDSPIFQRKGIDGVLENILSESDYNFDQQFSRAWSQVFTHIFKNIDPINWTDEEFARPVFCTLEILKTCQQHGFDLNKKESRSVIIKGFEVNKSDFVQLKKGLINTKDFIDILLKSILGNNLAKY